MAMADEGDDRGVPAADRAGHGAGGGEGDAADEGSVTSPEKAKRPAPPKPLLVRLLWRGLSALRTGLEVAVIAAALWLFVFQVSVVSGHSMDRSLEPGDRLVVDKLTPRWVSIKRFDVVVFEAPDGSGIDYVKRVVGLPGEEIELRGGELYIDGALVNEGDEDFDLVPDMSWYPARSIAEGHYFVLGDNRPSSKDSRSFGPIPRQLMKGIARFRVYPFGRAGSVR